MPLTFPLYGERVALRPFEPADLDAAHRVYGDAEVMRYVGEGRPVDRDGTAAMIAGYRTHQARHGLAFWAVCERGTGELLGDAGFEVTAHGTELGYTLARTAWGRGLATEAAALCIDAAFSQRGLDRLVALVDVENPASSRVLEKLGFRRVTDSTDSTDTVLAYGRPHHRYELLRASRASAPRA